MLETDKFTKQTDEISARRQLSVNTPTAPLEQSVREAIVTQSLTLHTLDYIPHLTTHAPKLQVTDGGPPANFLADGSAGGVFSVTG